MRTSSELCIVPIDEVCTVFPIHVTMWILHYVHDLEKSLREMARVVDPGLPNAKLVII